MSEPEQGNDQSNFEEKPKVQEDNISLNDESKNDTNESSNVNNTTTNPTDVIPPQTIPSQEESVINPSRDVVEVFDSLKDCQWGWGFQYSNDKFLKQYWSQIAEEAPKKASFKCQINWFSQDTEGFIPNEATKQYLIFWSWGYKIDIVKKWFKDAFPNFPTGVKEYSPSSDLAHDYWQGMPLQESVEIDGAEIIELPKEAPRRNGPVPVEKCHPISAGIPRYWSATSNRGVRDWLVPIITPKSVELKKTEPDGYLEEYIVEQIDYKIYNHPDTNVFIALQVSEEFNAQEGDEKPFTIPSKFRRPLPKFDYPGFGGYPGMDFGGQNFDENMDMDEIENDDGNEDEEHEEDEDESLELDDEAQVNDTTSTTTNDNESTNNPEKNETDDKEK